MTRTCIATVVLALVQSAAVGAQAPSKATVVIYRYGMFSGKALEPSVYCDDIQLAKMDNGRYFAVTLDPGRHTLRSNDKHSGIELDTKAGEIYYIRIDLIPGLLKARGSPVLVTKGQAEYEIKRLKPLGPDKIVNHALVSTGAPLRIDNPEATARRQELTNEDIIALRKAGLGDGLIIDKIKESKTAFMLKVEDLVALKDAGVSDAVIATMMEVSKGRQ